MTNQEKKEYLKKYIPAISQLEIMQERRDKIYNIPGRKTTNMPLLGVYKKNDTLANTICELVCMEDSFFEKEVEKYTAIISGVLTAIYGLESMTEQQVMSLRYIHGMSWLEIYQKMRYCEKQTHKYHADALRNIEIEIKKEPD
jgi:hypothetical protein